MTPRLFVSAVDGAAEDELVVAVSPPSLEQELSMHAVAAHTAAIARRRFITELNFLPGMRSITR